MQPNRAGRFPRSARAVHQQQQPRSARIPAVLVAVLLAAALAVCSASAPLAAGSDTDGSAAEIAAPAATATEQEAQHQLQQKLLLASDTPPLVLGDVELHVQQPLVLSLRKGLHCGLAGRKPLPAWITCDAEAGKLYALPPADAAGQYFVNVTVPGGLSGHQQQDVFGMQVLPEPPRTSCSVFTMRATVDKPWRFFAVQEQAHLADSFLRTARAVVPAAWVILTDTSPGLQRSFAPSARLCCFNCC